MLPSRYMVVDEKCSSYPVKRGVSSRSRSRSRSRGEERGGESAIRLLPPDPYLIVEKPDLRLPPSPSVYRTTAPKSAKNKEASSFVILGETMRTPVQSRAGSPSGRVSPFRGRGFKSPTTSRGNSRAPSPSDSPGRSVKEGKAGKGPGKGRVCKDIGLPPKSPMKSKPVNVETKAMLSRTGMNLEKAGGEAEAKAGAGAGAEAGERTGEKAEAQTGAGARAETAAAGAKAATGETAQAGAAAATKARQANRMKVETGETGETKAEVDAKAAAESKRTETASNDFTSHIPEVSESAAEGKKLKQTVGQSPRDPSPARKAKATLTPVTPRDKKPPLSPMPRPKDKSNKNQINGQESAVKKATKPPVAPKKIGLKTSLKPEDNAKDQEKKNKKEGRKERNDASEEREHHKEGLKGKDDASREGSSRNETEGTKVKGANRGQIEATKDKDFKGGKQESGVQTAAGAGAGAAATAVAAPLKEDSESGSPPKGPVQEGAGVKGSESKVLGDVRTVQDKGGQPDITEKTEKSSEKLVPCFQPDKCQIAPPTMASPSPIITPTISTPSMTSDLASSSMKNSQSIAAAPTTVTPSTLGSVSSTLVLTGNLARKEIHNRSKSRQPNADNSAASAALGKESELSGPSQEVVNTQMVKAARRDSIEWSKKDSLSGEMTSTKVITAGPDMEVLSPNSLRDSPPRMPPPQPPQPPLRNMAWDEGRLANGDVPNKVQSEGKFRRAISAVWRFLSYIFCCRCSSSWKCCRRRSEDGMGAPSLLSRLGWCKSCWNPFKCCTGGCKSKCCEERNCCRRREKAGKAKPKPKPKPKPRKCCAKADCSCKGCCDKLKNLCLCSRDNLNNICRSMFCLNMLCCQNFLRKCSCCHKLKCCQKNGFCSCCNPNVKKEAKKLSKKGSRSSNNSRDKDILDVVLVEHTSLMKAAIPVLPSCLAVFCLILNLFVPGFGTFVSGILCLCFGKPRFSVKDTPKSRMGSFVLNTIIGVAQLFTVVFCLVGWGWSIWWGVIMYKLSRRQKRLKLAEKNQKEAEGSNVNHNHVDVEQG